jgi:hypothetical protein
MSTTNNTSSTLPAFAESVYVVEGPWVRDLGLWFPTRMTVVRLRSGGLWIESPVAVSSAVREQIMALGPVRELVAGTPRHVWRLAAWHTLYPDAHLWRPPRSVLTVHRGRLPFAGTLGNAPPFEWAADFDQLTFQGNPVGQEIVFFHRASRTVILGDLIQVPVPDRGHPVTNLVERLMGGRAGAGAVPLDARLTFTNRRLARQSLERVLAWDFDRLILAHGPCVTQDAKAYVERAFRWLRH